MDQFSIYEYVLDELENRKGQWNQIAKETGLSYRTIEKIGRKVTADPGVLKIETLARYFRQQATPGDSEAA